MDYYCEAEFVCPNCQDDVTTAVEVDDSYWEPSPGHDPPEVVNVMCPTCFMNMAGRIRIEPRKTTLTLVQHPDVEVKAGYPIARLDDDWPDYDPPADPYSIFRESREQAKHLLEKSGGAGGDELLNRMVFSHYIGALEAFLSDTLINAVLEDKGALDRLLTADNELKKKQFSLAEIGDTPDFVKTTVQRRLRHVMWHNLDDVNKLYWSSLKFSVNALLGDNNPTLRQAIEQRHHCVHRNGYDLDGNKLEVFTPEYVEQIGQLIEDLVYAVRDRISDYRAMYFFASAAPAK